MMMSDKDIYRPKSQLFTHIATELFDPEQVLKIIENRQRQPSAISDAVFEAPSNPIQKLLAEIWAGVLNVERIGIHDNFFKVGGNSILATQLLARVSEKFKVDWPMRAVFEAPTIAELALLLIRSRAESIETREIEEVLLALEQMSEEEARTMLDRA